MTINASAIPEDLKDFPVRLHLTDARFARVFAGKDGAEIRVIDPTGRRLPCEIVCWAPDEVEMYVRLPRLKAKDDRQYFDIYFGNSHVDVISKECVWDTSYRMLLHLQGNLNDAITEGVPVQQQGPMFQNGWTPGLVSAESHPWATFVPDLVPSGGMLNITPSVLAQFGNAMTFTCRFCTRSDKKQVLLSASNTQTGHRFEAGILPSSKVYVEVAQKEGQVSILEVQGLLRDRWHALGVVIDGERRGFAICMDGAAKAFGVLPASLPTFENIRIGTSLADAAVACPFAGDIEEVRLASVARSESWLTAETLGLSEGNALVSIGPLESYGKTTIPPVPPELVMPPDGIQSHKRAGIDLVWRDSLGAQSYSVLIFKDPDARHLIKRIDTGKATKHTLKPDEISDSTVYWTVAAHSSDGESRATKVHRVTFYTWGAPAPLNSSQQKCPPLLDKADSIKIELDGYLRERTENMACYMSEFPMRNPGLIRTLRERPQNMVPWAGVFPGQYLSSAQLIWRLTHDVKLKLVIDGYVQALIACQREDGYLGPFKDLTGDLELWNHYAVLSGLLLYYEDTQFESALSACKKIGDLLAATYGPNGGSVRKFGGANESICHAMMLLYLQSGRQSDLDFVNYLVHQVWAEPGSVDFLAIGLEGKSVDQFPVRRWESVPNLNALSELYWITGEKIYQKSMKSIWNVLVSGDRHNTGGFSTNEGLLGTPYNPGTIETCCTVAWIALCRDMLKLTGDSCIADELEWSTLNSALGSIPYDGTTSTYSNQADGARHYGKEIFQGPPDGVELNCCSTNACRAIGMISDWALMQKKDGLTVNFYGASTMSARLSSGTPVALTQVTNYPAEGTIEIMVAPREAARFALNLRIPRWSRETYAYVNDKEVGKPVSGTYLALKRKWKAGDKVKLVLDFAPWFWPGEQECAGKFSLYRGPILFAFDARFNAANPNDLRPVDWSTLHFTPKTWSGDPKPWILCEVADNAGIQFDACDFSSAGMTGQSYHSWFSTRVAPSAPFYLEKTTY